MCSELFLWLLFLCLISYLISSIMFQSFALSLLFLTSHVSACSHACAHAPCLCPCAMPNACPCRCPRNFKYLWLPIPLLLLTTIFFIHHVFGYLNIYFWFILNISYSIISIYDWLFRVIIYYYLYLCVCPCPSLCTRLPMSLSVPLRLILCTPMPMPVLFTQMVCSVVCWRWSNDLFYKHSSFWLA